MSRSSFQKLLLTPHSKTALCAVFCVSLSSEMLIDSQILARKPGDDPCSALSIKLLLQLSLTLACIKAVSKTLSNIHGSSHVLARAPRPMSSCRQHWLNFSTFPQERFFSKIIFGVPEGKLSSGMICMLDLKQNLSHGISFCFPIITRWSIVPQNTWWINMRLLINLFESAYWSEDRFYCYS